MTNVRVLFRDKEQSETLEVLTVTDVSGNELEYIVSNDEKTYGLKLTCRDETIIILSNPNIRTMEVLKEQITIKTLECDVCDRVDSFDLSKAELKARTSISDMEVGTHSITHDNHTRVIYFGSDGEYLGDVISMKGN